MGFLCESVSSTLDFRSMVSSIYGRHYPISYAVISPEILNRSLSTSRGFTNSCKTHKLLCSRFCFLEAIFLFCLYLYIILLFEVKHCLKLALYIVILSYLVYVFILWNENTDHNCKGLLQEYRV